MKIMTQKDKELLLGDLCSRLPYFTKVQIKNEIVVLDSICDDDGYRFNFIGDDKEGVTIEQIKPYLFPISGMTEEQKVEYDKMSELDIDYTITQIKNDSLIWTSGLNRFNWLLKNHFDVYGLIPMGLAEDATNKNIY
jgi:hypothetical protein